MNEPSRIIITGFMGAGKTTVAEALAAQLGRPMIDLDSFIAAREGRSAQAIIDEDGEAKFREIETHALRAALQDEAARIIALGGGAWTIERNRALIAAYQAHVVWLDTPFDLCWQRITGSCNNEQGGDALRPLARDRESARQLYDARRVYYALAAWHVKISEEKSIDDTAAEIAMMLRWLA